MTRLRALLANEAGGGRGHVTTLRAAALALGPEITLISALARDAYADELRVLCSISIKAPLLARSRVDEERLGFRGCATWADGLATLGLANEAKLHLGLRFWRDLIVAEDISLLIADHAPLALWAARGLRDEGWAIRVVNLGIGYTVPPPHLPHFPGFVPDITKTLHRESDTLALMNKIGAEHDLAPLPRLAALYEVDLSLATTFPFLDPYADTRDPASRFAPLVPASDTLAGTGDGIFVYFSTAELTDPALVNALCALPHPRRGYVPSASVMVRDSLRASGMELLNHPATADEIAGFARLVVHAAPHGTVCMSALAGVAQFGVPQHLEQLFNARHAAAQGILHIGQPGDSNLGAQIAAAYADTRLHARAREVALTLRQTHPADPIKALSDRLAPEIAAARAAR